MGVRGGGGRKRGGLRVLLEQLCVPEPLRKQHYLPGLEFWVGRLDVALASRKALARKQTRAPVSTGGDAVHIQIATARSDTFIQHWTWSRRVADAWWPLNSKP